MAQAADLNADSASRHNPAVMTLEALGHNHCVECARPWA